VKVRYSLWAHDARVLQSNVDDLEPWMITVRPKWGEENKDLAQYGYVWLSDHEQEVVLPRLQDRIEAISEAIKEKIESVHAEAYKEVRKLEEQLQNLIALSYEGTQNAHEAD
jgi:hypothetical protein